MLHRLPFMLAAPCGAALPAPDASRGYAKPSQGCPAGSITFQPTGGRATLAGKPIQRASRPGRLQATTPLAVWHARRTRPLVPDRAAHDGRSDALWDRAAGAVRRAAPHARRRYGGCLPARSEQQRRPRFHVEATSPTGPVPMTYNVLYVRASLCRELLGGWTSIHEVMHEVDRTA